MEMLQRGSRGEAVEALQKKLAGQGINPGPIDGVFGPMTDEAVRKYQERNDLEADGVVGPKTMVAMGMMDAEDDGAIEDEGPADAGGTSHSAV